MSDKPLYTQKEYDDAVTRHLDGEMEAIQELCDEQCAHTSTQKRVALLDFALSVSVTFNTVLVIALWWKW